MLTFFAMSRLDQFLDQLRQYADLSCIESRGTSATYGELLGEVEQWRSRFEKLGVVPGTVVGVRSDYSLASLAALLALFSRHAVAALIPNAPEVEEYLSSACVEAYCQLQADGNYRWECRSGSRRNPLIERLRKANEGGVILFTSGSTGPAKAALQSVEQFLYKFRRPGRRLRTLAFLLFDHVAGLDTLFYTLASGGALIVVCRRDPASVIEAIESFKVEVLPTSPSFLRLLCVTRGVESRDLSSLKVVTYGSEPMDLSTLGRVKALFPTSEIKQKYGTTETGSPRSVSRDSDSLWLKIKCDGGAEVKVVDDVLWIRTEGMMIGYLNAPSPVDDEGWYCTGDLVDVDGEWIRFRGRVSDTINVGGEKVSPAEVEEVILELSFVHNVSVSGEPHPIMGQVVVARVALAQACPAPDDAAIRIRRHCRERLASYKMPIRIDIVTDGLTNDRQKVQRRFRPPN